MEHIRINPIGEFETIGWSKDVFYNGKYYGCITMDNPDRETIGYYGRRNETLTEDLKFKNKPIIRKGSVIMTQIHPLNGKIIKK